jgi:ribonuclease J
MLDGPGELADEVVRDRRHLAQDGVVVPVILVDRETGRLEKSPEIVTRGAFDPASEGELLLLAEQELVQEMERLTPAETRDLPLTRERARLCLRRFFKRRLKRRPMVLPVVMEI